MIIESKNHSWLKAWDEISRTKGKNYWQTIKKLSKYTPAKVTANLLVNGQTLETNVAKSDTFASHYDKTYQLTNDDHLTH